MSLCHDARSARSQMLLKALHNSILKGDVEDAKLCVERGTTRVLTHD